MSERIPGYTSTGSKRPEALFGAEAGRDVPARMVSSAGCRLRDDRGREYVDYVMALGAVALGYAHPEVTAAARQAVADGAVGSLPPMLEQSLAERLCRLVPGVEQVRFLKTGAEAVAAAVRLARTYTGRDLVLGCGYHGWLDWCQPAGTVGVPAGAALSGRLHFNDVDGGRAAIRAAGDRLAAVVFEPVVLASPTPEWLAMLRAETDAVGAVLVADEIKTICRLAVGGAAERYGFESDLIVLGKALANGFPLAAVGGRADIMAMTGRAWISSTLATEFVALAAADATLNVMVREQVPAQLARTGGQFLAGLENLAGRHAGLVLGVRGLPEMCFLELADEPASAALARGMADRGILFKRSAYNYVSAAHDAATVATTLAALDDVLSALARRRAPASGRDR